MNEQSTQQLITDIERKDRRFRVAQAVFFSLLVLLLLGIIGFQKFAADRAARQSDEQRDKIIRRLDCFAVFFNQTDRTNLSIADIEKCSLSRDGTVQQYFNQGDVDSSISTPSPTPTPTRSDEPAPNQIVVPQTPVVSEPVTPPMVVEPRPPVTIQTPIIDIPLCVPLVGICIRT